MLYGLAHALGVPRVGRLRRRGGLIILTYHSFGHSDSHPYLSRMPVACLARQIAHLERHFEIVALEDGLLRLETEDNTARPRPMVALTVDDGYGDNFEYLFPIIRDKKVPVTIFVATDYVDTGRLPWPTRLGAMLHFATVRELSTPLHLPFATPGQRLLAGRALRQHFSRLGSAKREAALAELERALVPRSYESLKPLKWDEIRQMQSHGVRFGAHTRFHGWLDRLAPSEVAGELAHAKQRIEAETGKACRILAYPNGNWNEAVADAAARAGYAYALTQEAGVNRKEGLRPLALHRNEVPYDEWLGTFACRISGMAI
jgi:peptidoglycan/xylan/chitin deacetylase (PgdA/CDA1 family)